MGKPCVVHRRYSDNTGWKQPVAPFSCARPGLHTFRPQVLRPVDVGPRPGQIGRRHGRYHFVRCSYPRRPASAPRLPASPAAAAPEIVVRKQRFQRAALAPPRNHRPHARPPLPEQPVDGHAADLRHVARHDQPRGARGRAIAARMPAIGPAASGTSASSTQAGERRGHVAAAHQHRLRRRAGHLADRPLQPRLRPGLPQMLGAAHALAADEHGRKDAQLPLASPSVRATASTA